MIKNKIIKAYNWLLSNTTKHKWFESHFRIQLGQNRENGRCLQRRRHGSFQSDGQRRKNEEMETIS